MLSITSLIPSPLFDVAVQFWMVLLAPRSKPMPVVGLEVAIEVLKYDVQPVTVQPLPVPMPAEIVAALSFKKAEQLLSVEPESAKMP
ncbi:hypothetical protein BH20VER1_BH20VER1_31610 [soil metagenome]